MLHGLFATLGKTARRGATGLGSFMGTTAGQRTIAGAGIGAVGGGMYDGGEGMLRGAALGAAAGRYGGRALVHRRNRDTSALGALGAAGRLARRDVLLTYRGVRMRASQGFTRVESSLKNWGMS